PGLGGAAGLTADAKYATLSLIQPDVSTQPGERRSRAVVVTPPGQGRRCVTHGARVGRTVAGPHTGRWLCRGRAKPAPSPDAPRSSTAADARGIGARQSSVEAIGMRGDTGGSTSAASVKEIGRAHV